MLNIYIPNTEYFDDSSNEFKTMKAQTLQLEHSLVSISKWESKWNKPFLTSEQKTSEETFDYIKCMTINQVSDDGIYTALTQDHLNEISNYIGAKRTATTFSYQEKSFNKEIITSELIYYWMIALTIPFECQKWHLNRLLTLINICNIKNKPPKKMSQRELANRNRNLNSVRRAAMNSRG